MVKKTKKQFIQFIKDLPSCSLVEDMWLVYCEGYIDGETRGEK